MEQWLVALNGELGRLIELTNQLREDGLTSTAETVDRLVDKMNITTRDTLVRELQEKGMVRDGR